MAVKEPPESSLLVDIIDLSSHVEKDELGDVETEEARVKFGCIPAEMVVRNDPALLKGLITEPDAAI